MAEFYCKLGQKHPRPGLFRKKHFAEHSGHLRKAACVRFTVHKETPLLCTLLLLLCLFRDVSISFCSLTGKISSSSPTWKATGQ